MSVLKSKRKPSQFEVFHHLNKLRKEITDLLLRDFGYNAINLRSVWKDGSVAEVTKNLLTLRNSSMTARRKSRTHLTSGLSRVKGTPLLTVCGLSVNTSIQQTVSILHTRKNWLKGGFIRIWQSVNVTGWFRNYSTQSRRYQLM